MQTQAMLSLIFNRFGKKEAATKLLNSIKDNAVQSDEMGMYWPDNQSGTYWYQAPVETQAYLIEAYLEAGSSATNGDATNGGASSTATIAGGRC